MASSSQCIGFGYRVRFDALLGAGNALAHRPSTAPHPSIYPPFPRPPHFPSTTDLQVVSENAKVDIVGPLARTHLTQTLRNNTGSSLEGSYLFALPPGAAVSNFAMTMNGKRLEAEVLEGDQAREIYTGIIQKLRDPAILEFMDRGLVRAKIFPVPAGGNVDIELDFSQTVTDNRYVLPLRVPGDTSSAPQTSVQISLQEPDLRAVYSPSHSVENHREGDKTIVTGEFSSSDHDFSLLWTRGSARVGLNLLTTKTDDPDGYFLLLAAPDPSIATKEIEAKDVVFVFDTSGSMEGPKIEQARRALKTLLGNLNPNDRFDIITFASSVQTFRDGLTAATKANIDAGRSYADGIKAVGGTNIGDAMATALKMTEKSARPQQIVFMTDGQPTVGQTSPDALVSDIKTENVANARLFVFGVGDDVNARLLDSLAEENHGSSDYVSPQEDIETKVGSLYDKIAYPVVTDAKIDYGALSAYDVYPTQLPDLFRGSQVTVFGRYRGNASGNVALEGRSNGQPVRFTGAVSSTTAPEMPKLWATRKVGYLIDDARRAGRPIAGEVKDEIVKLSQKYGVVTPLTAALITEDGAIPPGGIPVIINGNVPMVTDNQFAAPNSVRGGFGGGIASRSVGRAALPQALADTGALGVATAKATQSLREGRSDTSDTLKSIEGKTFTLQQGVWIDSAYNAKNSPAPQIVKFASPEYFELAKDAKLAKWLSVGAEAIIVWNGKTLKIEP